jgi:uncharacterized protein
MSHLPGTFVWFELVTKDVAQAKAFYGEVLGWKVEAVSMGSFEYEMIKAGEATIGGYAPNKAAGRAPHWTSYVSVDDVDAAVERVVARGGKVVDKASDTPGVGRMARVADAQGAEFNLFRSAEGDREPAKGDGTFFWNELWTTDATKALAFYEDVVGYTHKDMDMGPMGTYHVLEHGGAPRGGLMKSPDAKAPPMWLSYVAVADADAAAKRASKLGGKVIAEPSDIPGIGRFAILADPAGAVFAVIKPAAQ